MPGAADEGNEGSFLSATVDKIQAYPSVNSLLLVHPLFVVGTPLFVVGTPPQWGTAD